MKVLLYGLSANPPTGNKGHYGIIKYVCEKFLIKERIFDQLWLLPVYKHVYTNKSNLVPYTDRIHMLNFLLKDLSCPKVSISEIEEKYHREIKIDNEIITSYKIIKYLLSEYKNTTFSFIFGQDTFNDLNNGKWLDGKELIDLLDKLIIIERKGIQPTFSSYLTDNCIKKSIFINIPTLDSISSSQIRSMIENDTKEGKSLDTNRLYNKLIEYLLPEVAKYIIDNKLYMN